MAPDRRLRRFLHLERARPAGPTADPGPGAPDPVEDRIAAVERPVDPRAAPRRSQTGARLERFGPAPEPALELADTGARPFVRCHRCGMDSNAFATACGGCGERLDTPEQRSFDEQFWAGRAAQAAQEAQAEAELQAQRARADEELARSRRAMGEALAREVGDRERRRLSLDGLSGWTRPIPRWAPPGARLLRGLPGGPLGWALYGAGALLGAGMVAHGLATHSTGRFLAGVALLLGILLRRPG